MRRPPRGIVAAVALIWVAAIVDVVHASLTYYSARQRNRSGASTWNHLNAKLSPISTSSTDDRADARRRIPLHVRILLGLVVGAMLGGVARAMLGADAPALAWVVRHVAEPVGQLFLRALLMTVVPLVVSSLIVGVAGIGDVRRLGTSGRTHRRLLPGHFDRVGRARDPAREHRAARHAARSGDARSADDAVRRRVEAGGAAPAPRTNRRSCRSRACSCRRTRSNRWRDRRQT